MKLLKKILVTAALAVSVSAPALAAGDSPWVKYFYNEEWVWFYNAEMLEYSPETDTADVWSRAIKPSEKRATLSEAKINFTNKTLTIVNPVYVYTGNYAPTTENWTPATQKIIPGTSGEKLAEVVAKAVNRDEKRAAYLKEQKDKENQKKTEETIKKGLGILGGLF